MLLASLTLPPFHWEPLIFPLYHKHKPSVQTSAKQASRESGQLLHKDQMKPTPARGHLDAGDATFLLLRRNRCYFIIKNYHAAAVGTAAGRLMWMKSPSTWRGLLWTLAQLTHPPISLARVWSQQWQRNGAVELRAALPGGGDRPPGSGSWHHRFLLIQL